MIEVLNNSMLLGQFSVEPMFGWLAVVPLALVMLASLWLTLSSTGLSLRARWLLVLLRFLAMLLLLVGWLRPALVTQRENQSGAGRSAVLIDRSQSMGLASDVSDRSRWEVEREVWQAIPAATESKEKWPKRYRYCSTMANSLRPPLMNFHSSIKLCQSHRLDA
ncbi:MAG: hypothetical protein R3C56_32900 [Pirellulaceae bacterium]